MIAVWRIGYCPTPAPSEKQLLKDLGIGATLCNGRWHTKSTNMLVYAGSSRALCHLEKRVHCNGSQPANQALMRLELPDAATFLQASDLGLKDDWREDMVHTQEIGMRWLASEKSLGLWVPSYVAEGDQNLLINPVHDDYRAIRIEIEKHPFVFDPRLF